MTRQVLFMAAATLGAAFLLAEIPPAQASPRMLGAATQASYKNNAGAAQTTSVKKKKR